MAEQSKDADDWGVRETRLLLDTVMLGVVGALGAQLFLLLLRWGQEYLLVYLSGYQPPALPGEGPTHALVGPHGSWLIPLATTLGGLLSGLLVYSLAPEAEGHGTDTAVRAFHHQGGFIRPRVAPLKMIASAITIGSGGAAGREGPTALISAGIGSLFATVRRRSEEERQLLVLIGMAAGLSAIFRSPIGTAIFAIEVLYGEMEFESQALLYTLIGSIVAYAVNGLFDGWKPLFAVPADVGLAAFTDYPWYVVLGLAAGVVATALPMVFYGLRDAFRHLPLPPHLRPAVGGLGVGLIALAVPQVLGGGYGWIQQAIDGKLAMDLLLVLVFAKMLAFALTVSSGGSGGVFAPSLFVGAMLGGFLAQVFHQPPAAFAVVGMAALFGAAARVPIATMLMVTEMTGGYQLLVPAGLAVAVAYMLQFFLSRSLAYPSLYEAQVPRQADSPAHHAEQFRIALRLLDHQDVPLAENVGRLNFLALMKSGIPVDLPGGKRMHMGTLRADSPCAGTAIRAGCLLAGEAEGEIIAIVRKKRVLLPHPSSILRPGDQLVVLSSPEVWQRLAEHWEKVGPVTEAGES